ncbi:hypothetical protein BDR03DRAFT_941056 [Suillus americanus]|nr:hypothetical protein BDR03DRAFT_941056 [Suillus americanus]
MTPLNSDFSNLSGEACTILDIWSFKFTSDPGFNAIVVIAVIIFLTQSYYSIEYSPFPSLW